MLKLTFLIIGCLFLVQLCSAQDEEGPDPDIPEGSRAPVGPNPHLSMLSYCRRYPNTQRCRCFMTWYRTCYPWYRHPLCRCSRWCKWWY